MKKQNIVFMIVELPNTFDKSVGLDLLQKNYKELRYPFGFSQKVSYSQPIHTDGYYYMTASVYMDPLKYIKKCANSFNPILQGVCASWIKQFYPNLLGHYLDMKIQRNDEKQLILQKQKLENVK